MAVHLYEESHDESNEETKEIMLSELQFDKRTFDDWDVVATVDTARLCEEEDVVKGIVLHVLTCLECMYVQNYIPF